MSGIQFIFSNGIQTPFFKSDNVDDSGMIQDELKSISINQSKNVAYVSLRIKSAIEIEGIRLFDKDLITISDVVWKEEPDERAIWSDLKHIP